MIVPLQVLAVGSILAGLLGIPAVLGHLLHVPNVFEHFLEPVFEAAHHDAARGLHERRCPAHGIECALMVASIAVAVAGIGLAWLLYQRHPEIPERRGGAGAGRCYRLLYNKYYVDEIYGVPVRARAGPGRRQRAVRGRPLRRRRRRRRGAAGPGRQRPRPGSCATSWRSCRTSWDRWVVDGAVQPHRRHPRQPELRLPLAAERPRPALRAGDADHRPVHDRRSAAGSSCERRAANGSLRGPPALHHHLHAAGGRAAAAAPRLQAAATTRCAGWRTSSASLGFLVSLPLWFRFDRARRRLPVHREEGLDPDHRRRRTTSAWTASPRC